jgi:glycosyltransferase involved in cell wall biosynthesis/SAM-dependent methyltransferase
MNFSVALIARNEAASLPRLVKSLSEFQKRGGEIVLVDTGSTDNTVEVAKSLGCKVFEEGERFIYSISEDIALQINQLFIVGDEPNVVNPGDKLFNYSAARNYAASVASNNMVAMPDCDEAYTMLNLDALEDVIKNGAEQLEYQFVFAHDAAGNASVQFRHCKFYDRRKMRWTGVVHEILQGSANRVYLAEDVIKLEHWQAPQDHRSRYLTGLALDCFQNQSNDRNSHYLGREMVWTGRPRSAIKELTRHISMNGWPAERAQSMIFIGDAYINLGLEEQAVESFHRAFASDGSRRESLLRLAQHYFRKNDPQKVACYCAAALEIPWADFYANHMSNYTNEPHELMYWAQWYLGKREESKKHFDLAYSYCPTNPKYIHDRQFYYPNETKPADFKYQDQGIDGWMTIGELNWLYEQASKCNSVLELGSWKGRSSHALLSGCKGIVTCVDTFQGSADPKDWTNDLAKKTDIYKEFMKNVGHFKNLEVLRMTGEEAASLCKDRKFDMIFIDAGHTYEEVKKDIALWRDKATVILSGHDYTNAWEDVKRAVDECLGEVNLCESIWSKEISKISTSTPSGDKKVFKDFPQETHPERIYAAAELRDAKVILDVGCGFHKTVDNALGVDIRPITDITASMDDLPVDDNSVDLIISRHSFEHTIDPVKTLKEWNRVLKIGGRIIFVLPDQEYINTVDPFYSANEHLHAYTRASLENLVKLFPFRVLGRDTVIPEWSFGLIAEKIDNIEQVPKKSSSLIDTLRQHIELNIPFSFVKRGDGEEACMVGFQGANCDGHAYSESLGNKLKNAFDYLESNSNTRVVRFEDQEIYNTLLHRSDNNLSKLKEFYIAVRESHRNKVFVGPVRLLQVAALLKSDYVSIPQINAFDEYDNIMKQLKDRLRDHSIYIFCAGMPAKPMIAELMQANSTITCLDAGSAFDPLLVGNTRTHQVSSARLYNLYSEYLCCIPKRIFTIWLNENKEMPEVISKCIETQKIAGYDHHIITLDNYPKGIPYVEEAIKAKKWVKAADYLRMYELYEHGGIHCDADVEILPGKNFDSFLHYSLFIASEPSRFVNASLLGCIPNHPIIKNHLYEVTKNFKGDDDKNIESSIEILTPRVYASRHENSSIFIGGWEYFSPYDHISGMINVTPSTVAFHHFVKTWADAPNVLPKVSFLLPTLGREEGLKRCLKSIDNLYYPKHLIEVLVDSGEGTVPVKVNRLFAKATGDVMVFAANDIEFTSYSLYKAVKMTDKHGLVAFNTGIVYLDKGNICEHFLIWRDTIKKIGGEIFSEKFHHVGCDNLLWAKCEAIGEAFRCEEAEVIHHHFTKGNPMDEVYSEGWSHVNEDRATLLEELERIAT